MKFLKFTENIHTFKIPLSAYVHIFLHLPLTFHFIPSPFHFSISEVTLPPVQTFGICIGYTNRVQCCCNNSLPNAGAESHVSLSRGVPQDANMCLRSLPTPLPEGLRELCCWTAYSWGERSSPRTPNPRRQRTPALCRTSQHRLQLNLRACFSGAFKVGTNNIKLIVRGKLSILIQSSQILCSPLCPPEI